MHPELYMIQAFLYFLIRNHVPVQKKQLQRHFWLILPLNFSHFFSSPNYLVPLPTYPMILSWKIPEYRPSKSSQIPQENTAPSIPLLIGFRVFVPYKGMKTWPKEGGEREKRGGGWVERKGKEPGQEIWGESLGAEGKRELGTKERKASGRVGEKRRVKRKVSERKKIAMA